MSTVPHRRYISDNVQSLLEQHLPGQRGQQCGFAQGNRPFINAVFWILGTGAPKHDLSPEYGNWNNVAKRFRRWIKHGVWEAILESIFDNPDFEWMMFVASHAKVYPNAAGAVGGNQDMERAKGGSIKRCIWPWMRMVCWSEYLLQRVPLPITHKDVP